ncbi:MAG: hypothetical protein U9N78_03505 [Actinomycetota bacterium]|nr:hypothetical protein [Actinomycetota bacterium]
MTKQESFKRRVRERMEKTGEKYGAARRILIQESSSDADRAWIATPEMGNEAVLAGTGRGWNEWCDLVDAWPGHTDGHTAIARHLQEEFGVGSWWAQTVTVGWERITGVRLPYQMSDGTFTAGKSRTVRVDAYLLRETLLHDEDRADLFPGLTTELRSRPGSKAIRLKVGPGVAQIGIETLSDGRAKVTIQHTRIPEFGDVEHWKSFWDAWLDAVDAG